MRLGTIAKEKFSPPFRISIRTQLTALVSLVALVSLIILAVTTGVYFTSNYKSLRSERLYVAAQLKSSQIDQNLNYLYYQCYWLSSQSTLQTSLANYVSGNKTDANWVDSSSVLQKFLSSSALFSVARVYDADFQTVLNATNNGTGDVLGDDVLAKLMPLSSNMALPASLESEGMLTDPVLNGTSYLMSMSLPMYANPSIILTESRVYGYVTIIMSADSLKSVYDDRTALEKSSVTIVSAIYKKDQGLGSYRFVFAPYGTTPGILDETWPINNNSFLSAALRQGKAGSEQRTDLFYNRPSAVGYSPCSFKFVNWVAIISQSEAVFMEPSTRLTKIIIGVVVGIGAFVCIATFPLAHWAVQPIVRLQKATEIITEGRGLRSGTPGSSSVSRNSSFIRRRFSGSSSVRSPSLADEKGAVGRASTEGSFNYDQAVPSLNSNAEISSDRTRKYMTSSNLVEARVPVYRIFFSDEFSELTDTFNTMTNALDQHYALLEDRVRARTKQLEAAKVEAEAANEAKTVFIANISHELRTPLNGILGMTAISMEERDIDKIQSSLKLIFRSGELLLHILTELLTFSKNVLQRTKLEKRDFSITDVAVQIKSIFGKVAKDQRVKFSITLFPNQIRKMVLYGDSNRIIQIVMNLVSNALKFTPVDGKVSVRMRLLGEYDKQRSENEDFKAVYVIDGTEPREDGLIPPPVKQFEKQEDLEKEKISEKHNEEEASTSDSEKTNLDDKTPDSKRSDADDQVSLISISTSSYDDTIFHTQFKKHTSSSGDENGHLLEHPKNWAISVEVEDTGPGIDPSLHESVFEPFVQGDQALSRQYGGTGLGLSICRQLATMMNGTMKLDSKLGVGSKFTFTLPLTQTREIEFEDENAFEDEFNPLSKKNRKVKFKVAKSIKSRKSKSSLSNSSGKGGSSDKSSEQLKGSESEFSVGNVSLDRPFLQSTGTASSSKNVTVVSNVNKSYRILVAEDNHVNQEVIKRMLTLEGIDRIDLAADGQDAFDKVKALQEKGEHYELIFMDVQMPKVDGLLATKMIRKDLDYQYPIVALTAFADDSNIRVCLEAGMNGFLSKPIKRPKLKTIIAQYCHDDSKVVDKE